MAEHRIDAAMAGATFGFAALLVGVLAALLSGVPTEIVETSFYARMTPVAWLSG